MFYNAQEERIATRAPRDILLLVYARRSTLPAMMPGSERSVFLRHQPN